MTSANHTADARPARPGDHCACGRPALTVFITERFGDVPYCGKGHDNPVLTDTMIDAATEGPAAPFTEDELRDMPIEKLAATTQRLTKLAIAAVRTTSTVVDAATLAADVLAERAS